MSELEICGDCKKIEVYKNDINLCNECHKFVNKYYCEKCQLNHKCNKGLWYSKADDDAPNLEKIIKKFTQDIIIEINHMLKNLIEENKKLKEKSKDNI